MLGRHCRAQSGFFMHATRMPRAPREEREAAERAEVLVELLHLERVAREPVSALPFGTQKRVELARALASDRGSCCSTSREWLEPRRGR
jgi:branched-chain amino acid transport system ATP-binding protein